MSVVVFPWPYALVGPKSEPLTAAPRTRELQPIRDGIVRPGFRWSTPGVPHKGWTCVDVEDRKTDDFEPYDPGTCEMCGCNVLRFIHYMEHPEYDGTVEAGCVCAERMAEDYDGHARERDLKNRASRRARWLDRQWRVSAKGNHYLNVNGTNLGVFPSRRRCGEWGWWANGVFSRQTYESADRAKLALFDELTKRRWI